MQPNADHPLTLRDALARWTYRFPLWHLREVPRDSNAGELHFLFSPTTNRVAEVQEVAEALVIDPQVEQVLCLLESPVGQEIEFAVASIYLTPTQAELLTKALTIAWKTVRDQQQPLWRRADVLVGAALILALLGLFIIGDS